MARDAKYREYRGCKDLVYALVTKDEAGEGGYTTGDVKSIAGAQQISVAKTASQETHFYDDTGVIVVSSNVEQVSTFTTSVTDLATKAELLGKLFDPTLGMMVENNGTPPEVAVGYRIRETDGTWLYVWKNKGTFAPPNEVSATQDNGTTTNNEEWAFTSVSTVHEFTKGGSIQGFYVDEGLGLADLTNFFTTVQTPDTIQPKAQG
jgi:phi13 family phage major tail protein